jgi:hypothetical protein
MATMPEIAAVAAMKTIKNSRRGPLLRAVMACGWTYSRHPSAQRSLARKFRSPWRLSQSLSHSADLAGERSARHLPANKHFSGISTSEVFDAPVATSMRGT